MFNTQDLFFKFYMSLVLPVTYIKSTGAAQKSTGKIFINNLILNKNENQKKLVVFFAYLMFMQICLKYNEILNFEYALFNTLQMKADDGYSVLRYTVY